ncbi:MAG: flavocytochrome c [Oscillospiraceae bacterium]|nr:flavocytochrome c [Oscillospiraceae bacterium]
MRKRFVGVLAGAVLAASLIVGCATGGRTGIFTGSAIGHGGTLVVEADVRRGNIRNIEVVSHSETPFFYELPFKRVISAAVNDGNLNVDNVAGATMSTMAIRAAVADALTAAGINTGAMMLPRQHHTPQNIQMTADIVVVGGGGAGLAAAVTASQMGSSVIVLEKMSMLGGNTIIAGGQTNISGTEQQRRLGIADSPDLHFQHTFEGGGNRGNPELIRVMVENALDGKNWLESLGMEWQDTVGSALGALHPRSHTPVLALGTGFIDAYQRFIAQPDSNIQVLLDTRATEFVMQGGRVTGVRATNRLGDNLTLTANRGVINAAGGFGSNVAMRMRYDELWDGRLDHAIPTTNHPGATGEGILMAQAIGAAVVDMGYVQLLPIGHPATGSISHLVIGLVEQYIQVNEQGRRFVNEGAGRDELVAALFQQTNSANYIIMDSRVAPIPLGGAADTLVAYGHVHRANTIAELAAMINMEPSILQGTFNEFNAMVDGDAQCPFGRILFGERIEVAPFFATRRVPTVHHTMGGIVIDRYARVIDVNGNIIPGFYAAGEVAGGIHGNNRLGANALTDIFVFGRIAGESAVLGR